MLFWNPASLHKPNLLINVNCTLIGRKDGAYQNLQTDPLGFLHNSPHAAVGLALDEEELAVGGGDALRGVGDLGGRIDRANSQKTSGMSERCARPLTIWRGE